MIQDKSLDPRTKLIIVISISSLSVFIQDLRYLIIILAIAILVSKILGSEIFTVLKKLRRMLGVFIAMIIVQSLFIKGGNPLIMIGKFTLLTDIGIFRASEFLLRISIILVSATILMTSTSREILQGLVEWKIPYEIAFMVSVAIRFLPLLGEELQDTLTAIQLRGIDMDKLSIKEKIKLYSHIFTPVVAGAIVKSQRLSIAMECRGFRAYNKRTSYIKLKMNTKDYLISTASIITSIFIAYIYLT
ncbi:energy-coupling factor transporter transmembrane component T family protein [Paramaledivibacter caminithermalis]|jgi:energy-coupling factor transport system permease protein|uniref:Energy-coupling factor transport system permease protein n=1 Tax=Paramaledivibacter caminithermalis (strain DSM 15212 / CIP 107654 / DViRD3) TaxID=1121301 RepID=A0A1M6QSW8_PARC5|nr:energy-coupling factor transporter transmembrane component T [Paramaledivibacter caminithermalis]SHK23255.1 energy-coupling factor transport system permease protein [Paramaledivibacter caminithermalis DSM 15212]